MKLKWEKYFVLAAAGFDNVDEVSNNTIFSIKSTDLYVLVVTLSAKGNQKLSKLLGEDLKDQLIGMNIKQRVRVNI